MVVRASAVLESRPIVYLGWRLTVSFAVVALLIAYYVGSHGLPDLSLWSDAAFLSLLVIPGLFSLVYLALPLRRELTQRHLAIGVGGSGLAAVALEVLSLELAANFTKFAAVTLAGWLFLEFFESVAWILLVAILIVPVDIYSVAQGPTREILDNQPRVFDLLSVYFPIPAEQSLAQLGLPDVLFFVLFLGAADRFRLRVGATWVAMGLSFGATLSIASAWENGGLPALPLLSIAFVLVNADLFWKSVRRGTKKDSAAQEKEDTEWIRDYLPRE